MRKALLVPPAIFAILIAFPASASATISGPCSATLNGESVDAGRDSAGSAINVDYQETVPVEGSVRAGTASAVDYKLKVAGLSRSVGKNIAISSDKKSWGGTVGVKEYAWAAIGLYEVVGTATTSAGPCTGTVYVCVTGKNPVTTVAGGVAAGAGLLGALGIARGLLSKKAMSPAQAFAKTGRGGFLGALGGVVLLQQGCVLPLTPVTLAGAAVAGVGGFGLIGLIVRKMPGTAPVPATGADVDQDDRSRRERMTVYQFTAAPGSCSACRNHALNRVYMKAETMRRAHPGCTCSITSMDVEETAYWAYFQNGGVYDRRKPILE